MKKIAILTSGGDAPGMNACIRAVVRYALFYDMEVWGIERGYEGLINDKMKRLERRDVSDILQRGGTMLKTARSEDFTTKEGRKTAAENLSGRGIDNLIVIGGNGTFSGANLLCSECGINTIGIPGTIDNDLYYTNFTLGFDTAVNTVLSAINNLRDTMTSHDRICIVEVMGRNCGDIALYAGIAGGAEAIIVPEVKPNLDLLCDNLAAGYERGKTSDIVIVAEGAMSGAKLEKIITERVGLPTRSTVLGYIQRGGAPTLVDRLLAARFAVAAVDLIRNGQTNRAVGVVDNKIIDVDISSALKAKGEFDINLYNIAQTLSI